MFKETTKKVETVIKTKTDVKPKIRLSGTQRLRECGMILSVLLATFIAISLFTFSPADPSWSQTTWGGTLHNGGGYVGAWFADTLFFTFGSLAYPLPLGIAFLGWKMLRQDQNESGKPDFMIWGARLLGLTMLLLTSCSLANINFDDLWYFSSGGVIGDVLSSLAIPTLNILGTTLVMLFLWGAGFTLFTGISWMSIVETLGGWLIYLFERTLSLFRQKDNRELVVSPDLQSTQDFSSKIFLDTITQPSTQSSDVLSSELSSDIVAADVAAVDAEPRSYRIHLPQSPQGQHVEMETTNLDEGSAVSYTADDMSSMSSLTIEELEQVARAKNDLPIDTSSAFQPVDAREDLKDEVETHSVDIDHIDVEPEAAMPTFSAVEIDEDASESPLRDETNYAFLSDELNEDDLPNVTHDQTDVTLEDSDVIAFQNMVADAQQAELSKQNPFLMRQEVNLPTPTEPLPTLELLYHPEKRDNFIDQDMLEELAKIVESKLSDYKIKANVVGIYPGPVITRFELDLAPGVKVSRISGLSMDLARSLSAAAVRVVEVIPGKPYVGLELPNLTRQTVYLSDVVSSEPFQSSKSPTTIVLGQDIAGDAVIADLAKMPHVLVAGTTGSGKSVGVNVMILSMLYKASPEEVRFIMIDPKMLELSVYEGIPHLLSEVVTDMKDASNALRWCVAEMERRYKLMSVLGVRNIKGFNEKLKMAAKAGHPIHDPLWKAGDSMDDEPPLLEKLPFIVVIVDEFADLMMVVGKKVEELIARLAQKARAAGIHLILATQRPSVDVITGLIKANIPTRVAFTVSTKTDSRTILDQSGAESLLGMGDMLYLPPGSSHTVRVHGAFASDDDVHAVVNNWKARGKPNYIDEITHGDQGVDALLPGEQAEMDEEIDPLFDQVVEHVVESRRGSVSGVQRRFKIGYNRAARIVEQLETQGIVSAPGHNGNREVLAPPPIRE